MPGRGMGERLAVDPNKNSVLYLGAPSGKGLWRSTDSGATWSEVTAFPNPGNYSQDPTDTSGYGNDNQGIVWVTFDERSGSAGNTTQDIYVGVADKENTVYRSTDGGVTWSRIAGQPTGYLAHKGVLDSDNGYLYLTLSDTGGPYDGGKGRIWRYTTATGEWKDVSPVAEADTYYGFSGLSVDRQQPGTLMATAYSSWWPDTQIFRSTDSGATWTQAWDYSSYPNRTNRFTQDVSSVPWLTWGANPTPPETSPKLGWMTEALEIDPFDSNRMMYGTGATIYGTENLKNWDSGSQFKITPMVKGLEETAVNDLASPPSGAPLLSALGDIGGFRHTDLDAVPDMMFTSPNLTSTTSLDFAESSPNTVVRVGSADAAPHIGFSTDNGSNWFQGSEPAGVTGGGTVAAAADASGFVWSPEGVGVQHTTGYGSSWSASTGIPAGATVESDRKNPKKFYGYKAGDLLRLHGRRRHLHREGVERSARRGQRPLQGRAGYRGRCVARGRQRDRGLRAVALHRLGRDVHQVVRGRAGGLGRLRQGGRGSLVPDALRHREDRRRARCLPFHGRGYDLDPDQRRRAPVGLDRCRHHR